MKRGFSLVELMVVMSLLALLTILGVSGLFAYSNATVIDKAAEEIMTVARDAQNRAIAVTEDETSPGSIPYVWGIHLNSTSQTFEEIKVNGTLPSNLGTFVTGNIELVKKTNFKVFEVNASNVSTARTGDLFLYYSAPYGRYYLSENDCNAAIACTWNVIASRPKDYVPSSKLLNTKVRIEVSYKNNIKNILIDANGDSYVE